MIQVTKSQYDQVIALKQVAFIRGRHINSRIVYELWPSIFNVRKRPNGCSNCLKSDMMKFLTEWDKKWEAGEIEVEGAIDAPDTGAPEDTTGTIDTSEE